MRDGAVGHRDSVGDARTAASRLDALEAAAGRAGEDLFARNSRVIGLAVSAWRAQAEQDTTAGPTLMREAAALCRDARAHAAGL